MRLAAAAPVLVALLSLAAACGDDTTTTGATSGGDGGSSGDGGSDQGGSGPTTTATGVTTSTGETTSTGTSTSTGASTSTGDGGGATTGEGGGVTVGQGGAGGDGGAGEGGAGGAGTTATGSTASSTASSTATSTASTGGGNDCTPITLDEFVAYAANDYSATFDYTAGDDAARVLVASAVSGAFTLGQGVNASIETCEQCVVGYLDYDAEGVPATLLFAAAGTLTLPAGGVGTASLANVELREIDQTTFELVPDGVCLSVAADSFDYSFPVVPGGWTCDPTYYGVDDGCDCGCGVQDLDCPNTNDVAACTFDNCAVGTEANPANTTQCVASGDDTFEITTGDVNVAIPDANEDGVCVAMQNAATGTVGSIDEVRVAVSHTFAGDLTFYVVAPTLDDYSQILFEPLDNAGSSTADLSSAAPIAFDESALVSADSLGAGLTTNQVVCSADGICRFQPAPDDFSFIEGIAVDGTWYFCAVDAYATDTGTITRVDVAGTLQ